MTGPDEYVAQSDCSVLCQDWVRRARENAGRPVGLLASPGEGDLGCKMTGQQREVADSRDMQLAEHRGAGGAGAGGLVGSGWAGVLVTGGGAHVWGQGHELHVGALHLRVPYTTTMHWMTDLLTDSLINDAETFFPRMRLPVSPSTPTPTQNTPWAGTGRPQRRRTCRQPGPGEGAHIMKT